MQLAVSTLTCPDWDLATIARKFQGYNVEAVDFRGLQEHINLVEAPEFADGNIESTRRFLKQHHVHISGISTSVKLADEETLEEGYTNIELAHVCNASYIRVMAGRLQESQPRSVWEKAILNNYKKLLEYAETKNIQVLLETHDEMSKSEDIRTVIDTINHSLAGIIWDIRHPLHLYKESFEHTVAILGKQIKVVHLKDIDLSHDAAIVPFGSGDFDPAQLLKELQKIEYDGYFVLEVPKRHRKDLPDPDEMIPAFVKQMKPYITE